MKRNSILVLFAALVPHLAVAQFKSATLPVMDDKRMLAASPTVKSIRVEPGTMTIRVGQTVSLSAITVVAVDSTGKDVGRLSGFDFRMAPGGAAVAVPRQVTGKRPGSAELTLHYPTRAWTRKDPRPAATVKIDVKP